MISIVMRSGTLRPFTVVKHEQIKTVVMIDFDVTVCVVVIEVSRVPLNQFWKMQIHP
jgi:hypothetical protein